MMENLVGKYLEIETDKKYFYHGKLVKDNDMFINIIDVKKGNMWINKNCIKIMNVMSRVDLMMIASKGVTFWDRMKIGEDKLDAEVNALERKIFGDNNVRA
jgi:hypothetical protein